MKKVPISLIIDDPAPVVSVYHYHIDPPFTLDGRPLVKTYPNELLYRFCDVIEQNGIKGKFSVVPMPANLGDVVNGIEGVSREALDDWMHTVKSRVMKNFTVGPEMLTHHKAVDLQTGEALALNERDWASTQSTETLTPYIAKALSILKQADINAIGVTSPWDFGIEVEDDYQASISRAVYEVSGSKNAWFFLRTMRERPNAKPWVALEEDGRTLVSIPSTLRDRTWQTIDCPDTSDEYVSKVADMLLTADGKQGDILTVLETGGYPILISHWQSLMSNGLGTGIRVLEEVAKRINTHLCDRVEWMNFEEIMHLVLANKADYPKPEF